MSSEECAYNEALCGSSALADSVRQTAEQLSMNCVRGFGSRCSCGGFLRSVRFLRAASLEETWERKLAERSYFHAAEPGESWKFLVAVVFYISSPTGF